MTAPTGLPEAGSLVVDIALDRPAVVMAYDEGKLYLRPPEGGVEWTRLPNQVRPAAATPPGSSLNLPFDRTAAVADLQHIIADLDGRADATDLHDVHEAIALAATGRAILTRITQHTPAEETTR